MKVLVVDKARSLARAAVTALAMAGAAVDLRRENGLPSFALPPGHPPRNRAERRRKAAEERRA